MKLKAFIFYSGIRILSVILSAAVFFHCSIDIQTLYQPLESIDAQPAKKYNGPRYRVVVLEFHNSAEIDNFEITADADVTHTNREEEVNVSKSVADKIEKTEQNIPDTNNKIVPDSHAADKKNIDQPVKAVEEKSIGKDSRIDAENKNDKAEIQNKDIDVENSTDKKKSDIINPDQNNNNFADAAREMTETALVASGRFEVVPAFVYRGKFQENLIESSSQLEAYSKTIHDLKIDYLVYGDLTEFEIKTQTSYWKVPFWAILLVGSFFIKDDDTRNFIWYALIRTATIVPLDHALWKAGVGQEDVELDVTVAMDLRLVDSNTWTVLFSETKTILRKETASNMELVVWQSGNKVRIRKSNAGRQIRFAAIALTRDLSYFMDSLNR